MVTLVRNGVVLPMTAPGLVLDPGAVLIDGTESVWEVQESLVRWGSPSHRGVPWHR
jgi:hypothetical protein